MDSAKKQLNQWDYGTDTITITGIPNVNDTLTTSTIDLSSINLNSSFDYNTLSNTVISQNYTGGLTAYDTSWSPTLTVGSSVTPGGTIELRGEDADIVVNGVSLMDKINAIAERLNLLDVNKELEAEWDQLRELGELYRQLEQDLKTKSEMWNVLKTKTPSKLRS
jgi:hypothetical protein